MKNLYIVSLATLLTTSAFASGDFTCKYLYQRNAQDPKNAVKQSKLIEDAVVPLDDPSSGNLRGRLSRTVTADGHVLILGGMFLANKKINLALMDQTTHSHPVYAGVSNAMPGQVMSATYSFPSGDNAGDHTFVTLSCSYSE